MDDPAKEDPAKLLQQHCDEAAVSATSREFAEFLDSHDSLSDLRQEFHIPKNRDQAGYEGKEPDEDAVYLLGNSLGLQPVRTRRILNEQLDKWATVGIEGHFSGSHPWKPIAEEAADMILPIVGGKSRREVAVMNGLTVNLHLLLVAFYQPTKQRHKIVIESGAFPSDRYAVRSQIKQRGYNPADSLIELKPRDGESVIRYSDIEDLFERDGDSIAVLVLGGVQFYTGQLFDMERISALCHRHGCYAGFDLAHAAGNIPLHLHDWNVDFACWCTYKYLNSGPGGVGGAFIHEQHAENFDLPRFAGWWGNDPAKRFEMTDEFEPLPGVAGFQLSNPPMLPTVSLIASLEVFGMTSMEKLRSKSRLLTYYMEQLLCQLLSCEQGPSVTSDHPNGEPCVKSSRPLARIVTPQEPDHRGCQLSIYFPETPVKQIQDALCKQGIVADIRKPDVIRVAAVPLYNRFVDVHRFVTTLAGLVSK